MSGAVALDRPHGALAAGAGGDRGGRARRPGLNILAGRIRREIVTSPQKAGDSFCVMVIDQWFARFYGQCVVQ